ncbi:hypothetical protein FVEN_g231 [Fusarium venenatum]|uniref:Nudix hydrolase domain-containing protein n=1 Tax=Fusarium venenatum TaxID=56646 RepID=A0A2L2TQU9_9HYPO|nr:uncharacterized protein FVRRES_07666 [Fusarium venenatum]KAG8362293.1 hypothetical protein FVEN_g231 [Fusarium venenatum]KAH6994564.1 hypothetical protein EDB82DRAFT_537435 [Fusarium venenatum]CEI63230.1 unnamed protein product [Fusarium venenatum]
MDITTDNVLLSDQFIISCGTVTLNKQSKVLLIFKRTTTELPDGIIHHFDEVFLPEDWKDIGESLEKAAIRGAYEKTAVEGLLLPAHIMTNATIPTSQEDSPSSHITEPIAVSHRVHRGILDIIFWYIAEATTSTIPLVVGKPGEERNFVPFWMDINEARHFLSFTNEKRILEEAIAAVERGQALAEQAEHAGEAE